MSQIILDEHLGRTGVVEPLRRWITAAKVEDVWHGEIVKDERLRQLLRQLKHPPFVTIDDDFWDKQFRDPNYCLIYFDVPDDRQREIPLLLRRLLRLPPFKTKAVRRGEVVRVSATRAQYWELNEGTIQFCC